MPSTQLTGPQIARDFAKVREVSSGAQFVKVDLHVHTPASGDAQWKNRYDYEYG